MMADFDIAADSYDEDFTRSQIGILQRKQVWTILEKVLGDSNKLKILELNCGTGEDASRLALNGHEVVATDISEEMLNVARSKNENLSIKFMRVDLNAIDQASLDTDFDLAFSNFGGINCLDHHAVNRLGDSLSQLIKPGGKFIAVIMPKACIWESAYMLLKGKTSKMFRRNREFVHINVSGNLVKTWYYNPKDFSTLLGKGFKKVNLKPIGLFIPPSYMEGFFARNPKSLRLLKFLENLFANFSWQSRFSDHYFIQYEVK